MRIFLTTSWLSLFFIFCHTLEAQQVRGYCGTQSSPVADAQLDANIAYLAAHPDVLNTRGITYVPVRFTIVRSASGNGGVNPKSVFRMFCKLNEDYLDQDIQFYMKDDFKYLNNDLANTDPQSSSGGSILKNVKDKTALNIFFVEEIKSSSPGSVLGFFSPENDYLVVRNSEANYESQTTSHEMGHFFSLRHTFYGWECEPWNVNDHGQIVTFTIAPCFSAQVELVNGSNCSTAADKVCDTPPDYNFGFGWPNDCRPFNVDVYDKNNDLIRPSQNNFMSYFFGCTGWHFSQGQKNLIRTDLNSSKRSYLKSTYTPPSTTVSGEVNYQYPINNQEALRNAPIVLQWENVPGATFYIVEYSRRKSFDSNFTVTEMVRTNQVTIPANYFPSGAATGYWRVIPMNEAVTCNVPANGSEQSFTLVNALGTKSIDGLQHFVVKPNVLRSGNSIQVEVSAGKSMDCMVQITDINGRVVYHYGQYKMNLGMNKIVLDEINLSTGIYIVSIKNKSGINSQKLIVR